MTTNLGVLSFSIMHQLDAFWALQLIRIQTDEQPLQCARIPINIPCATHVHAYIYTLNVPCSKGDFDALL